MRHRIEKLPEPQLERLSYRCDHTICQIVRTLEHVASATVDLVLGHVRDKVFDIRIASASEAYVLHGMLEENVSTFQLSHFQELRVYLQLNIHSAPFRNTVGAQYCVQLVFIFFYIALANSTTWHSRLYV